MVKQATEMSDPYCTMHITVCYSPAARVVHTLLLVVPASTTVRDAVALCVTDERFAAALQPAAPVLHYAVWGVKATAEQVLKDADRLELCRPLRVDPKVARRERFAKQGARTSGLFATRRPGAKSGY
jgi:uncharacterized protein